MYETTFADGTEITAYLATAYAEGFCEGAEASHEDNLRAWAYLIRTRMAFSLQGFFGRTAQHYIDNNVISLDGVINWEYVDELINQ